MKRKVVFLAMLLFIVSIAPALAQDLPENAVDAVKDAALILGGLAALAGGLAGSALMDLLKKHVGFLSKANRDAIGGWFTWVIVTGLSGGIGYLVETSLPYAQELDKTGLWGAISTILAVIGAAAVAEFRHRARKIGQVR